MCFSPYGLQLDKQDDAVLQKPDDRRVTMGEFEIGPKVEGEWQVDCNVDKMMQEAGRKYDSS